MNLRTIKYWMISAAALAALTRPAYAEIITASAYGATPTRMLDAGDECPIELPSNKGFTDAEEWAWRQICAGRPAIMPKPSSGNGKSERCGAPEPEQADNWASQSAERHALSPRFIKLVAAHAPYTEASAKPLVHIECAIVDGRIDLSNEEIKPELRFRNSFLKGELDVSDAHFHHSLLIDGSVAGDVNGLNATVEGQLEVVHSIFTGTLSANNLKAGGDVFLVNTKFKKDVSLHGADVEENLELIHSIFTGTLSADNLSAGGDVFLAGTEFKELSLHGANVEENLEVARSAFTGTFLADNLNAAGDVLLRDTKFEKLSLYGADVEKNLEIIRSAFTEKFSANNLNAAGNVLLRDTKFEGVDLRGANVEKNLEVISSIFTETFSADNLNAGGDVLLKDTKFEDLRLFGANVEKNLWVISSIFTETFSANSLNAAGNVLLRDTKFEGVDLRGANVEKNLGVASSTFTEKFSASSLDAGNDVLFLEGAKFSSEVSLVNAKIEGKLRLEGASFYDKLDLSHAQILESFILYQHQKKSTLIPLWEEGSELILRNAYAKVLHAKMHDSWIINNTDETFVPLDLNGFTYDWLDGMNVGVRKELGKIIEWVNESTHVAGIKGDYRPQPYRQLAKVLREMGETDQAKDVDIARYDHYYSVQPFGLKKMRGWLAKPADYGIKLWSTFGFFLIVWFAIVLVQTTILALYFSKRKWAPAVRRPIIHLKRLLELDFKHNLALAKRLMGRLFYCFAYSFENLLPVHLMKRSPYREGIALTGCMLHLFFWFRLSGFVVVFIATILILLTSFIGPE